MTILFKEVTVQDPSSSHHGNKVDILVDNGIIMDINTGISREGIDEIISVENVFVSQGWMDCFANFCDPGNESRETIRSGSAAAAAGGFTDVMLIPQTNPVTDSKSQVQYIIDKSRQFAVNALPIGAVSRGLQGRELAEMYDMHNSGAIAFSDGYHTIQPAGMLQKAMEYLIAIDVVLIQLPDDKSLGTHGLMNEGLVSTRLGLQGKPALAEELMISRDIDIAIYTGAALHFTGVSTAKSLRLISAAKNDGVKVTCSATPYHLFFSEEDLLDYNTYLKVNPPLRTTSDRDALRNGVKDGTIDFIASHHQPQMMDDKICEFEYANDGMECLESVFAAVMACGISPERFVNMQTRAIRSVFKQQHPGIAKGAKAKLTLFTPGEQYIFDESMIKSKSRNNAFIGQKLQGSVAGIINGDKLTLNHAQLQESKT